MIIPIKQSKLKCLFLLSLVSFILFVSGCAGPKIANDLLGHAEKNNTPLINNTVTIDVKINPTINNYEKIDESVKESLEIALINANIFGADSSHPYRINANIMVASQSPMSFGSFEGKLKINYILFDETNNKIIDKTIYTEAGSDKMYFSGAKRHRRARAVNISKNVLQFVDVLQNQFNK
jgi:hypothetical protein